MACRVASHMTSRILPGKVYQTTPRLRPVKLCITELKALRLEGPTSRRVMVVVHHVRTLR